MSEILSLLPEEKLPLKSNCSTSCNASESLVPRSTGELIDAPQTVASEPPPFATDRGSCPAVVRTAQRGR